MSCEEERSSRELRPFDLGVTIGRGRVLVRGRRRRARVRTRSGCGGIRRCRGLGCGAGVGDLAFDDCGGIRGVGNVGVARRFLLVGGADVVTLLVVRVLAEVVLVLGSYDAALGRLLDRERDPPAVEIDVDDLHPELFARE